MHFFKKIWVVGSWLDPWTIMHLLFGVCVAAYAKYGEVGIWKAGGGVLVVSLLWEILEMYVLHWQEPLTNRFVDVFITMVGFSFFWWLLKNESLYLPIIYGSIMIWVLILVSGIYMRY